MNRASAAYGRVLDGLVILAALLLLAMVAVVTADVLLRNLTRTGFAWSNEISEYALYAITLLTAPWLLRRGQHVRLDLVLTQVPQRVAWLMEAASDILGFAVSMTLVSYGVSMTLQSQRLGSITIKTLVFPEWWLLWPLPLFFALLALEFVFRFHRLLTGERTRRAEATSVS
jgi:TRAP-type C4-dicarboxylate transport system permease small subunit